MYKPNLKFIPFAHHIQNFFIANMINNLVSFQRVKHLNALQVYRQHDIVSRKPTPECCVELVRACRAMFVSRAVFRTAVFITFLLNCFILLLWVGRCWVGCFLFYVSFLGYFLEKGHFGCFALSWGTFCYDILICKNQVISSNSLEKLNLNFLYAVSQKLFFLKILTFYFLRPILRLPWLLILIKCIYEVSWNSKFDIFCDKIYWYFILLAR